jgi:NADP-dependent 3-hydroxy acid dehydrogenase YdfG
MKAYQVVILSPTKDKVKSVAGKLRCDYVVADVTDYDSLMKAVKTIVDKFDRIDCLINSAGLWIQDELDKNDAQLIEKVIKVNTLGLILTTKAVIGQMKQQKSGLIININSQSGLNPREERSVYVASKWAVTGFTRSLQPELAQYGIRVTGILPGGLKTAMFDKSGNPKDQSKMLDPKEVAELVGFLLTRNPTAVLPEIGIKFITN